VRHDGEQTFDEPHILLVIRDATLDATTSE
jgi:hypothetical protein